MVSGLPSCLSSPRQWHSLLHNPFLDNLDRYSIIILLQRIFVALCLSGTLGPSLASNRNARTSSLSFIFHFLSSSLTYLSCFYLILSLPLCTLLEHFLPCFFLCPFFNRPRHFYRSPFLPFFGFFIPPFQLFGQILDRKIRPSDYAWHAI